jgi:DNA segregation ATPase FtsK/SpoIIIE, S-DNA-T family
MIVSKHLSARETLGWLDRLRDTLREGTANAGKLDEEFALNAGRIRRQTDKEIAAQESHVTASLKGAETGRDTRKNGIVFRHDQLKLRIQEAHERARESRLSVIEAHAGRQIAQVQRELLAISREMETALTESDQRFAALRKELEQESAAVEAVERGANVAVRGYPGWQRRLAAAGYEDDGPAVELQSSVAELKSQLAEARRAINRVRFSPPVLLFSLLPPWLLFPLVITGFVVAVPLKLPLNGEPITWTQAGIWGGATLGALIVLHLLGGLLTGGAAKRLIAAVGRLRRVRAATEQGIGGGQHEARARIRANAEQRSVSLKERWNSIKAEADAKRAELEQLLGQRLARVQALNERLREKSFARVEGEFDALAAKRRGEVAESRRSLEKNRDDRLREFEATQKTGWETTIARWNEVTTGAFQAFAEVRAAAAQDFPAWSDPKLRQWTPPTVFASAAPLGALSVDLAKLAGALPTDPRLKLPGPASFDVPLLLTYPGQGSVLFETKETGRPAAIASLNELVLRLLSVSPPGRVVFTILDPLDLGQSFAGLMHLADHEERLINQRIWTQPEHIEQRLAELNEHIEKVTQLYLRNEFATIAEYNEQAGRIAEPYHFLVIADFPTNFTDLAARRLMSIAASGQRCGVYTFVHWYVRKPSPNEFVPDDLRAASVCLRARGEHFAMADRPTDGALLKLETPPDADFVTDFLGRVGRASLDSNRVEVPFTDIVPAEAEMWSQESTSELRVAIGRTGATKLQQLALGKGTKQHVLVAGKTGSGKSTLFHVMITNLALWHSPDQVEFYLVDFKKGVEFKCYGTQRLPHARVVAIESDREFGLSVLERVDEELRRRGDLFRKLGVQDVAGFKRAGGQEALPRTLLIIDEFQEFFTEDDRVAQTASLLLDRLVRQGRAFGIHVLLGSQTLGGAYTLARTTLGQMVVRIALQCNEADAMLIMEDDNVAARLLSRPGEAIYNDAAGAIAGNNPFQIVWLGDNERDQWLEKVRLHAEQTGRTFNVPVVFEGNAPADVRENPLLTATLATSATTAPTSPRVWLGAPNSIKGPTEIVLHRQSGHHLLIVGQRDETALALLGLSVLTLAAQHPAGAARFVVFDALPAGSTQRAFMESVVQPLPHDATLAGVLDVDAVMTDLSIEFARRADAAIAATAPAIFVVVNGLQRFKGLKVEDDFSFSSDADAGAPKPGAVFNQLISEGADRGMHVLGWCDTWNNLTRQLNRKAISEFELRVLFQMSATDSASLMDAPAAGNLGLHRAILYNAQAGTAETFRPYALPDREWVEKAVADVVAINDGIRA